MLVFNSDAFHKGIPNTLQLLNLPPTQFAVNNVTYQESRPSLQVTE